MPVSRVDACDIAPSGDESCEVMSHRPRFWRKSLEGVKYTKKFGQDSEEALKSALAKKRNPMKKARKTKKAPSAKQLAARRKFTLAAKKRSKAAKAKRPAKKATKKRNAPQYKTQAEQQAAMFNQMADSVRKKLNFWLESGRTLNEAVALTKEQTTAGAKVWQTVLAEYKTQNPKKRNSKTIIKAKRVTILNLTKKKNPPRKANITSASDLAYAGTAKKATQDGVKGWQLGSKFFPGSATTKAQKITASAYLDLRTGDVWKRRPKANPKKKRNALDYSPETPIEVTKHYRSGGPGYETKRQRVIRLGQRDLFAPEASIDELMGYLRKSNPSVITAVKRKMGAKAFAKASPSVLKREMKAILRAELAKRKPAKKAAKKRATVRKTKRRNPNADMKAAYESFQGKPSTKSTSLNFPNGTPANVYKLGTLHSITLQSGAVVKPAGKTVWLCADTKGKLHLGTSGERLVNAPKGALGKVKEVEYITTKPHLGDNKPTRYYHELGEETGQKPTLYSDGAGGLVFKGGATYVRSDGIHN